MATSGADVFGKEQTFFPTLLRKRDSGKPTSIMNKKSKNLATVVPTEAQYSSTQGRKIYIKRSSLASLKMRGAKKREKKSSRCFWLYTGAGAKSKEKKEEKNQQQAEQTFLAESRRPKVQKSKIPKVQKSKRPKVQKSEIQKPKSRMKKKS